MSSAGNKILLVNAPYLHLYGDAPGVSYYFPLGIGYIASYLEREGYEVEMVAEYKGLDVFAEVNKKLERNRYLLVGLSSMTPAFNSAVRLARMVREKAPGTPTIIGGPHVSAIGESVLDEQKEFDFLSLGEGELTTLELALAIEKGQSDFSGVPGLAWRDGSGKTIVNENCYLHPDIDDLPYPSRHLVDFKQFSLHTHVSTAEGGISATMVTSRGCPYKCIFCSAHLIHGRQYRLHSDDYVINEIKLLREKYNVSYIFFEDDTFTVNRKRVKRLCKRIEEEASGLTFGCFSRVDVFDEDMAMTLSSAGCKIVIFGIESGVQETLENMRKNINIGNSVEAIGLCKKYGISSFASFVVGLPFETPDQIKQTIDFGLGLGASTLTFNPFVPFPGTPLYDPSRHKPETPEGWEKYLTTDEPPFDMVPGLTARQLKAIVDRAHLKYYMHPKRLFGIIRDAASWSEFKSLVKAFFSLLMRSVRK